MLQHELIQDGGGVQLLGEEGLLGEGVGALGPDLAVLPQHQLGGEALGQHVVVVIHVVKGDDQGFLALGEHEGVALHALDAVLAGDLAPHIPHVHQDVALVIDALEDLLELVRRHHPVVQALLPILGHRVGEGELGVGDHRVEEQVLHHLIGAPGLGELLLAPVGAHRLIGVGLRRGGGRGGGHGHGGVVGGLLRAAAAGGHGEHEGARQRQGGGSREYLFHR